MKKGKYLLFYERCMETNKLPGWGLCCCTQISNKMIKLIEPTEQDRKQLEIEGFDISFWGSGEKLFGKDRYYTFTPLRQTLVLFMAAVRGEL